MRTDILPRNSKQLLQNFCSVPFSNKGGAKADAGILADSVLLTKSGKANGLAAFLFIYQPCVMCLLESNRPQHPLPGSLFAGGDGPEHISGGFRVAPNIAIHLLPVREYRFP